MSYTVLNTDAVLIVENVSRSPILLPSASGSGRLLYVKNLTSGTITVQASGTQTIDANNTLTLYPNNAATIHDFAAGTWATLGMVIEDASKGINCEALASHAITLSDPGDATKQLIFDPSQIGVPPNVDYTNPIIGDCYYASFMLFGDGSFMLGGLAGGTLGGGSLTYGSAVINADGSIGYGASQLYANSTAVGYAATATGMVGTAVGFAAIASAYEATAIGANVQASGANSVCIGSAGAQANADFAIVIGEGIISTLAESITFGNRNTPASTYQKWLIMSPLTASTIHLNLPYVPRGTAVPAGLNSGDVWCDTTGGNNILKIV